MTKEMQKEIQDFQDGFRRVEPNPQATAIFKALVEYAVAKIDLAVLTATLSEPGEKKT